MSSASHKQIISAIMAVLSVGVGSTSVAAPSTVKSGGWVMTDSHPGERSKGTCIAQTAGYYGKEVMDLMVRLDKTGARPIEVLLRPRSKASNVRAFRAAAASGKTAVFQKLATSSFGQTIFWYIPNGTDELLAQFKATNQFNLNPVGAAGTLPLSMSGSSGALAAIMNTCVGPNAITSGAQFEKAFLPANINSVQAANIGADAASAARDVITAAVTAHKNVLVVQAELDRLEAKYAAINAERRSLNSTLSNLADTLSSLTSQKISAQNTIDTATSQIASLKENIAAKQMELAQAQVAAANALEAIRPFVPEHDRLQKIMNGRQSEVDAASSRLADIDNQIQYGLDRITSLTNEVDDLKYRIQRQQDNEYRTRLDLDRAERESRGFNPDYVIRDRINNDYQIQNIERNLQDQRRQISQAEQQVNQAMGAKMALENAYNQCMANAGASRINGIVSDSLKLGFNEEGRDGRGGNRGGDRGGDRGPRPGEGGGPGGGGPRNPDPGTPVPVPSEPPVGGGADCSGLAAQLATANNQLDQSRQSLQRLQYSVEGLRRQKDDAVRGIERDVYQQQRQLADRVDRLNRDVNDIQSDIYRMNSRVNEVIDRELPNARNDLSYSQSQRPGAVSTLQSAQSRLNAATAEFRAYKVSVNYDALKATVNQTAATVTSLKNTIAGLNQQVASREALIVEKTNLRNSLTAQIDSTNKSIASNSARLEQVEKSLVPYNSDKAEVVGRLNEKQGILTGLTRKFASLLSL